MTSELTIPSTKKILYVDMDGVLVDFEYGIACISEEDRLTYKNRIDECPGIFGLMQPIPGAVRAFNFLSQHFDTYILSTPPWNNPSGWIDKINWVHKYLGQDATSPAYKRLILSHYKNLNMGHYLIDDRRVNGAENFMGEHIQFGTSDFPNWKIVIDYLIEKEGLNV